MELGKAWCEFLSSTNTDATFMQVQLKRAFVSLNGTLRAPVIRPFTRRFASKLLTGQDDVVQTAVTVIDYIQNPQVAPLLFRSLFDWLAKRLPFTEKQFESFNKWVSESPEGAEFLGLLILFLSSNNEVSQVIAGERLIELTYQFRNRMNESSKVEKN